MPSAPLTATRVPPRLAWLGRLWPAGTRRVTGNALAALLTATISTALLLVLGVPWGAALFSVIRGPNNPGHITLYAAVVLVIPVLLPWALLALTGLARSRLRATLELEFPGGLRITDRRPWLIGPLRAAATWRQFAFHASALGIGLIGGGLVALCWLLPVLLVGYLILGQPTAVAWGLYVVPVATLLAAPWLARLVSWADERTARAFLGPSKSEELAARVETLARSRASAVAAADAERRRIERDLHDGAQQRLVSLAMNLGIARETLTDLPEDARQAIASAHDEAVLALSEVREFIRGLHPAVLNDRGLDAALSGLAARAPLPVRVWVDVPVPASASIEAVAYFIVSEALTNIAKHAQASQAEVTVVRDGSRLRVVVADDGRGGAVPGGDGGAGTGTGLRGLAQRAAAVDGTLSIDSPPGGPTFITAELPCES
jgi:signal transduction histidine kinase